MKQKKLRELVNIEFAKALAAEKARVDKENAFRLGRFCVENHIDVFEGARQYIIHASIGKDIFGNPKYEFSISQRCAGGRINTLYHLEEEEVISRIIGYKDEIYAQYERLCDHAMWVYYNEGRDIDVPCFPRLIKAKEITKESIRKAIIEQTKNHWSAPVHAPKGKGKHKKVRFEQEEYEVLPALNGSKSLLEGRNAIGNLYESDKWENPMIRTHIDPRHYKVAIRATRRALRKQKEQALRFAEEE